VTTMQGRKIQAKLWQLHDTLSWRMIAREMNAAHEVRLSPAAYQMWANKDIEPAAPKVREAFGLGPQVCPHCHRAQRSTVQRPARVKSVARQWWDGLSAEQREQYIEDAHYIYGKEQTT
jgi:hypothetical protein